MSTREVPGIYIAAKNIREQYDIIATPDRIEGSCFPSRPGAGSSASAIGLRVGHRGVSGIPPASLCVDRAKAELCKETPHIAWNIETRRDSPSSPIRRAQICTAEPSAGPIGSSISTYPIHAERSDFRSAELPNQITCYKRDT